MFWLKQQYVLTNACVLLSSPSVACRYALLRPNGVGVLLHDVDGSLLRLTLTYLQWRETLVLFFGKRIGREGIGAYGIDGSHWRHRLRLVHPDELHVADEQWFRRICVARAGQIDEAAD